ncbi:MAG: hypothetical protein J6U30_01535 [Oscillospiraceae bacterium]|nr:hypothetical protein [Oscillospiraceae bacterium]MBP1554741.1 hypothetical protein [Oscillospiraceae bacterium]
MAVLSAVFAALAVILSDVMCAVVAFNFCDMLWGIRYAGYSAPASVAFMTAVPYAVGIIICVILSLFLKKRA